MDPGHRQPLRRPVGQPSAFLGHPCVGESSKARRRPKFSGNNDETFNNFDAKQWDDTVKKLDQVLTEWEKAVEAADDKKIQDNGFSDRPYWRA